MKFLERNHYCEKCNERVFLFQLITTKEFIKKKHTCPICKETQLISYWREIPINYMISVLLALPFFFFTALYSLWRARQGILNPVDIFISVGNIFFGGFILVYSSLNKKKPEPPSTSDHSIKPLKKFRLQNLYVVAFNILGFLLAVSFNTGIWFLWNWISS